TPPCCPGSLRRETRRHLPPPPHAFPKRHAFFGAAATSSGAKYCSACAVTFAHVSGFSRSITLSRFPGIWQKRTASNDRPQGLWNNRLSQTQNKLAFVFANSVAYSSQFPTDSSYFC
ncbi:unnamed protein product, partial [Ixodes pacificus]